MTSVSEHDVGALPTQRGDRVHRLAPGTELLGEYRDSAYEEPKFLVQRADGQAMQLPRLLYGVACSLDGRADEQIAADLNAELGADLSADQVSFLVEERLRPAGLVAPDDTETDHPDDRAAVPPMPVRSDLLLALRYRAGVIPAGVVWRIAGVFQPLFRRPVWALLLTAFVAVDAWIVLRGDLLDGLVAGVAEMGRHPGLFLTILGLTVTSGILHEFGHVSACRYGGARPGDIGVGLYLVWPAFYSNVTDSYRLDRVGRLRTDLGGLFIDAVFMGGLGLVYLRTGEPWLLIALLGMHVEAAWQLLPSLRLDGYYILGDLVGVPDLFSYVKPALRSLLPGRPLHPAVRELKPRARRIIVAWVVAVVPTLFFWAAFLLVALPRLLPAAWQALHEYLQVIDRAARGGEIVTTAIGVTELVFLALPWAGGVMGVWMLVGVLRRRLVARSGLDRVLQASTRAAVRRGAALVGVGSLGVLLVARVAQVALDHPATADETRLAEGALAAVRDTTGGPPVPSAEWLVHEQLVLFARSTGAFGRHATVVAGARELAVLASAVLVLLLVTLVAMRRVPPLAAALPLLATLAMGPAVATLATIGAGIVGSAWAAGGVLLLTCVRSRAAAVAGALAVTVGVATEPLVAVALAACAGVLVARAEQPADRSSSPHRRASVPPPSDAPRRASAFALRPRHPRHARPDAGPGSLRRWLAVALVLPLGGAVAATATGGAGMPLHGPERTVLLLVLAVVVAGGLLVRPLRSLVAAAGSVTLVAALPWAWAGDALVPALVAGVLLAVFVTAAYRHRPAVDGVHPMLRTAVAVPVLLLTVAGALLLPVSAPAPPHAALAAWITAPDAPPGTLLVPAGLWGDLVHDGVPAHRLVREGTGSAASAYWTVSAASPGAAAVRTFGEGSTALTVEMSEHARIQEQADQRASDAAQRVQATRDAAAAVQQAARQAERAAFGSLLADTPGFSSPPAVEAALRGGGVDMRVLAVLGSLSREYAVAVAEFPVGAGEDPGAPRHEVLITKLGYAATVRPDVAAALDQRLASWAPPMAPAAVTPEPDGVRISWAPEPQPSA